MKMTFRIAITCLIACSTFAATTAFADDGATQVSGSLQETPTGTASLPNTVNPGDAVGQFDVDEVGHVSLDATDAQGLLAFDGAAGRAVTAPFGPWISLDQRYGEGIGYQSNYWSVRSFIPTSSVASATTWVARWEYLSVIAWLLWPSCPPIR